VQTLPSVLASPASRLALFLGRTLPSTLTGFVVAAISFVLGAVLLDVRVGAGEAAALAVAVIASSYACTAFGLCLGALGLRGRNVSLFADSISGCMLLVSGANVPLDRLPEWMRAISSGIPLTHGIDAARRIARGASVAEVSGLLSTELLIGTVYVVAGLALLRFFEYEGRRTATLETF
jgi:ABC-2 type transport system permease protein